jgi:hypothetical protein
MIKGTGWRESRQEAEVSDDSVMSVIWVYTCIKLR